MNQQIKIDSIKITFLVPNQQWLAADGVEDGEEARLVRVAEHRFFFFLFFLTVFCHRKNGENGGVLTGPRLPLKTERITNLLLAITHLFLIRYTSTHLLFNR